MLDCDAVLRDAVGRWHGILGRFGMDVGDGKHRPCPLCGGKDRFRFDDKGGEGTWICNQCGAGDGLSLLMKKLNVEFQEACLEVSKVIGTVQAHTIPQESKASPEKLKEMFVASKKIVAGDPVTEYLINRGLSNFPSMLRYHPKCWEYETKSNQQAMLAVFSLPDGKAVTIHRTFIKDGKKLDIDSPRKVMPPLEKMTGGAVRLYTHEMDTIGVCEGIETAIAVHQMFEVTVWAALSATLLESFVPPVWAKRVEIYADNDDTYTGQRAAYILANRLVVKDKTPAFVLVAKKKDFLEDLIGE